MVLYIKAITSNIIRNLEKRLGDLEPSRRSIKFAGSHSLAKKERLATIWEELTGLSHPEEVSGNSSLKCACFNRREGFSKISWKDSFKWLVHEPDIWEKAMSPLVTPHRNKMKK